MKNNKGFTLIEIIISIAVLSIISAIFLELFIKSDFVQKQGKITDDKAFLISNVFETLIAEENIADFESRSTPQKRFEDKGKQGFEYYYNQSLNRSEEGEAVYFLQIIFEEKEKLKSGKIYLVTAFAYYGSEEKPFQMTTHFYEKKGD